MRDVRPVKVGDCVLDGKHIYIQSMLNMRSDDIEGSVRQAVELEKAGCEIIRAAIPNMEAVKLIPAIKEAVKIPLVADIHFDYKLAIESAAAGVDKIRINPGNIGGMDRVKAVVDACRARQLPIRIGVNSGSLEKELLAKYGSPTPEALVESALNHAAMLEHFDFNDIVISIKSSDVGRMIASYRLAAEKCSYPLHLGVTEAGTERMGLIKSAIGIGSLLCDGIGETIRVSLTDDPIREIAAAKDILKSIGKRGGVRIVSCPTCGRTRIDLVKAAKMVEEAVRDMDKDITVAVMGCIVNGPGEAREADVGIAGGDGCAIIFRKDGTQRKIREEEIVPELLAEIDKL
ncbi:MAG: flavodoxin-dependent (E)-4-hydroxy-3-methylbut-2-enyl-diphosphate synthase [Ruminococcus sp.]|uniref:flavodoxin-dependent (E)-4-hydroxy-3-methylbut-2-enyl-diphosphate synthase n=1 Tax=Ruminococcus sp. TaxID=41978 RepID=UPI0025FF28AD|nr:flavodoxin-dependent (E)-4-hydroxy-3-methylbut-2-enyl-diphosphate synthase [Ruminococcus sp.]MBR3667643.1 flavodoxin-dependent (E)-4-hydroxy-3-methylbut-2-enyl-diphosphate synthase [Ruminococcus sp.]MBR6996077.1 flavodoxin-dependent (E)-4-hydroxy-3-methylbut-2-enyl-diphosphate synthase [Ruminococcus sp.]